MEKGFVSFILHAHLPFVRHPLHDNFLEEKWLYEAITETYIPLIHVFQRLDNNAVPFRLTMSLTPTLISMLQDPLLQDRYICHINKLIELAEKEIERTRFLPEFHEMALYYYHEFVRARETFQVEFQRDIVRAFKGFQERGRLEIITCASTHAFLPLTNRTESAVHAQIETAVRHYSKVMGREPIGFWLPECGYFPGVDNILKENGIRYFITDTIGVLHASPRPKFGVFAPIYCKSGVAAFARDVESSRQVWSAIEGYPGDYAYRDFYRDIGFDLEYDYVRPYIAADGKRISTGIKYYRITGDTDDKQPYVRSYALEKVREHAGHFVFCRDKQIEYLSGFLGRKPIVLTPYDAELYGHWWHEGIEFLGSVLEKMALHVPNLKLATPSDYLQEYPVNQVSTPSLSSWGWKGYSETWLSGANQWIYRHIYKSTLRMQELTEKFKDQNGLVGRALKQAMRELFLAQSSDWAFMMHTGTTVQYANARINEHLLNFEQLYEDLNNNSINEAWLGNLESVNNIFSDISPEIFSRTASS